MDLSVLLDPLDLPRLSQVLDELGHLGRVDTVRGWDGATMALLFDAIKGYQPLSLDYFVPPELPPLAEVIHHGKNSLPAFTLFQKRFCKPAKATEEASGANGTARGASTNGKGKLWGYNHNPAFVTWFAGAGYYVAHDWEPGEIVVDYTLIPPEKPATWPDAVFPNARGIGPRAVYGNMVDIMRGLSKNVSIGRARRCKEAGKPESSEWMDAWFVLCREDAAPAA
jgi:hypothetical protein